jgi:hypothetical protein
MGKTQKKKKLKKSEKNTKKKTTRGKKTKIKKNILGKDRQIIEKIVNEINKDLKSFKSSKARKKCMKDLLNLKLNEGLVDIRKSNQHGGTADAADAVGEAAHASYGMSPSYALLLIIRTVGMFAMQPLERFWKDKLGCSRFWKQGNSSQIDVFKKNVMVGYLSKGAKSVNSGLMTLYMLSIYAPMLFPPG